MDRILIAILLLIFIILGCSNRGATTIEASVTRHRTLDSASTLLSIRGYSQNGFHTEPRAILNGDTLQNLSFEYSTSFTYYEPLPALNPGDTCHLVVEYGHGVLETTEILPAEFRITAPDTAFVLYYQDDLTVNWEAPAGAEWYKLRTIMEYYFDDTTGTTHVHYCWFDTTLFETTYTVSSDKIFPDYVDSLNMHMPKHGGLVEVIAVSGPNITNEDEANFYTADVDTGWLNCFHYADRLYFELDNR